jgi:hypothetical protein
VQDKHFSRTANILFDGEAGLSSTKSQKEIFDRFGVRVYADAGRHRYMAERAIKEIKIRLSIALDMNGEFFSPYPTPDL